MNTPRHANSFFLCPWTGDTGNALGLPWRTHVDTAAGRVSILNDRDYRLTDTPFDSESAAAVLSVNHYCVEVMNIAHGMRGTIRGGERMLNGVSWDYESSRHVGPVREAIRIVKQWWGAFAAKPWAQPLQPYMEGSKKQRAALLPISPVIAEVRSLLKYGAGEEAGEELFTVPGKPAFMFDMRIATTYSSQPLILLRPLQNAAKQHKLVDAFHNARRAMDELDFASYRGAWVDDQTFAAAARRLEDTRAHLHVEISEHTGDELLARNAAWQHVVVPTMNAFRVWKRPELFPLVVRSLNEGIDDIQKLARVVCQTYDAESGAQLRRAATIIGDAVGCFGSLVERNRAFLEQPSAQRRRVVAGQRREDVNLGHLPPPKPRRKSSKPPALLPGELRQLNLL